MIANDPDPTNSSYHEQPFSFFRTNIIIACSMLFLVMLMITDTFILPALKVYEVVENGTTSRTRKKRVSYYLQMESKRRYHVTKEVYHGIAIGERCIIDRTLLFRRPIKIAWCKNNNGHVWYYVHEIGALNKHFIVFLLLGYLIIWPLGVITGIINPDASTNPYTKYLHLAATVVSFIYYCCS